MNGAPIGNPPKNYAVLPFYGTAALFFLILSLLMFVASGRFQEHFFQGQTLALVHAAALGWGTMIIFGAAYQLLPVICEKDLFSSRLGFLSFIFLFMGTIFLIATFWYFKTGHLMIYGGSLVFLAAILYNINVFKTANLSYGFPIHKAFLISSALWLLATIAIGLLLAINLAYPFFSKNHLGILKIHAHVGLVGWFLQLITGVSTRLVPMFLLAKSNKDNWLKMAFTLQNVGLIAFISDQYFFGSSARAYLYFILVVLGILYWVAYLRDVYLHRLKRKIEVQMKQTFLSFVFLFLGLLLIPILISFSNTQWNILYGIFIFLGWISSLILGKTFKTLPFIKWNRHYKTLQGKMKLPLPKDLYNEKWLRYQFWIFIGAMSILSIGVISNQLLVIKCGLFLWILVAVLYTLNVLKIFLHKPIKANGT
jgi:cbb3-type cytochrome oxidase subunit 1